MGLLVVEFVVDGNFFVIFGDDGCIFVLVFDGFGELLVEWL